MLAKPVSRGELLLGKFLGCWLASGLALACFYVFFGCLAASREQHWPLLHYLQAAGLHWVMLGVVISFSLLGSLEANWSGRNLSFSRPPTGAAGK